MYSAESVCRARFVVESLALFGVLFCCGVFV